MKDSTQTLIDVLKNFDFLLSVSLSVLCVLKINRNSLNVSNRVKFQSNYTVFVFWIPFYF